MDNFNNLFHSLIRDKIEQNQRGIRNDRNWSASTIFSNDDFQIDFQSPIDF